MDIDLDAMKIFFDPHPGFLGATVPIPGAVKKVADELNSTTASLRDATAKIKAVTKGNVEVYKDCITLKINGKNQFGYVTHFFRVIRFKSI